MIFTYLVVTVITAIISIATIYLFKCTLRELAWEPTAPFSILDIIIGVVVGILWPVILIYAFVAIILNLQEMWYKRINGL